MLRYANAIIDHDRRRPGFPSALLVVERDNNRIEESTASYSSTSNITLFSYVPTIA